MNLDLDLDNYNLKDLIQLFQISYNFTEDELQKAKKIVLQMHPDKSKLDKKYFLFFSAAYKIIHGIYKFRRGNNNRETNYTTLDDKKNDTLIKNLLQDKSVNKDFNKWFNELFEKTKIEDEYTKNGYGNWLKSEEDLEDFSNVSKQDIDKKFEEKKEKLKSLIVYNDFTEINTNNYELTRDAPSTYSSDIFSKLNFEDLKKAHQESIVPVTLEDYHKKEKMNLEQMKMERNMKIIPSTLDQAKNYIADKKNKETQLDINRAYKLIRQDERYKEANNLWWSNIKQLK